MIGQNKEEMRFEAALQAVLLVMLKIGFEDSAALETALFDIGLDEELEGVIVMAALRRLGALQAALSALSEPPQVF